MPIPTQQLASLWTKEATPPEVETRPVPTPADDEALIEVTATAINPVDWKIIDHGFFIKPPSVLGSDAAGKVVALGKDVTEVKVGDRVFFQGLIGNLDRSTFQQYVTIPAPLLSHTPANVTDDEAAGIALASVAAWTGLYSAAGLAISPAPWDEGGATAGAGKALVVLGGSSSVGQYAIQLGRLSGFRVVTAASPAHTEWLKKIGASVVLDRHTASASDFVAALDGKPLVAISDSISLDDSLALAVDIAQTYTEASQTTDEIGVATVLAPSEASQAKAAAAGHVALKPIVGISHSPELRPQGEKFAHAVTGWLASGAYFPNRPEVTPGGLRGLPAALEKNKKGVSGVKVVIRPQETTA